MSDIDLKISQLRKKIQDLRVDQNAYETRARMVQTYINSCELRIAELELEAKNHG